MQNKTTTEIPTLMKLREIEEDIKESTEMRMGRRAKTKTMAIGTRKRKKKRE